jgi:hypothetical protein
MKVAARDLERMAHPTGVGRGVTTHTIPIEGRDGWLPAAGLGA